MQQTTLKSLLIGAGAGLASAHPAVFDLFGRNDHHHHDPNHHGHTGHATSLVAPVSVFPSYSVFPSGSGVAASAASTGFVGTRYTGTGLSALPTGFSVSAPSAALSIPASSSAVAASTVDPTTAIVEASTSASVAGAAAATGSAVSASAVTASSGCTFTDADSAISGKKDCTAIVLSGIAVPAGTTLDMTDLADGTTVTFEGTTTFGYKEWDGPLVSFSGTDITIQGASGHLIDMGGVQWWDGEGSNGGKTKPKGFYAHDLTDSVIKGINIKNTPIQCYSINGASNLQVIDPTIDNSEGDGDDGGHNTDAFDIGSSTGVYISGANVKNQDDCVAINSGTDISFTGGTCSGGHGLSIGSVGGRDDNDVANVVFSDSTVTDSDQAVRIKAVSGATGSIKNITYSGITMSGIAKYGIVIEQDYENGSPTGTPTDGVPITDVTLENIKGTVSGGQDYYILCASCSDWTVSGVSITGGEEKKACEGVPSEASSLC